MSDALAVRPAAGLSGWRLGRLPDDRLVARVRAGDDRAFEALFDRHHRPLLSFCRHMLGQADEAEDAVQQTFIRALAALRRDDRPVQLKAWLYGIARNRCLTILGRRRELPGEAGEVEVATEGLADEVQRRDDLRALIGDLQRLPADQRAALLLAELGSHSHEDVAAILACPRDKVKALVFQAREALIAQRQARDTSCVAIRATLATARGADLRRAALRRHLRDCAGCRDFKSAVGEQRSALALLLPVTPSAAFGLGGASAATGGAAAGVGVAASASGSAAAERLGTAALTGGAKALAAKALVAATIVGATGAATGALPGVPSRAPHRSAPPAARAPARPFAATAAPRHGTRAPSPPVATRPARSPAAASGTRAPAALAAHTGGAAPAGVRPSDPAGDAGAPSFVDRRAGRAEQPAAARPGPLHGERRRATRAAPLQRLAGRARPATGVRRAPASRRPAALRRAARRTPAGARPAAGIRRVRASRRPTGPLRRAAERPGVAAPARVRLRRAAARRVPDQALAPPAPATTASP